jgi:enamine deaminase RidA (YjgF/YER057c/UK114 family)
MKILQPPGWPRAVGYANGVAATGTVVFVAGQIGWNSQGEIVTDDLVGQVRQALQNVVAVLAEAGGRPEHITRMTWYLTDRGQYLARRREIGAVFREIIGVYQAAMTAVQVTALIEDRAQVEIEVTAVLPTRAQQRTAAGGALKPGTRRQGRRARTPRRRASTSTPVPTRSRRG